MQNSGVSAKKPRIVFFGNERLATGSTTTAPVLRMLIDNGYDVALLVVSNRPTKSRRQRELEVLTIAQANNIPVVYADTMQGLAEKVGYIGAEIGVLVAFGRIIPQSIIGLFPQGIINIHPSALPKHRGPTPIESVILTGETSTAVNIMELTKAMDAGPIYATEILKLTGEESKQELVDKLGTIGASLLQQALPGILARSTIPVPQDESDATYDVKITKEDSELNLSKTAMELEREVRAYLGWPGSYIKIADISCVVTSASIRYNGLENVDNKSTFISDRNLCLQTADGILIINSLKPAGKKNMSATEFLAGYKQKI